MPKPNYHQARKQKELARKARQQEKQQKRATKVADHVENPEPGAQGAVSADLVVGEAK